MVLSANKLQVFRLLFSDPGRTFYSSGDKLSGSVQLEAAAPCRLTGLRVTAAGCARVHNRNRSQEVEYLKYEEEVRLEEVLSRGEDEQNQQVRHCAGPESSVSGLDSVGPGLGQDHYVLFSHLDPLEPDLLKSLLFQGFGPDQF